MAHYIPDYEDIQGRKLLEELSGKDGELIKYHVAKKDKWIAELEIKIYEMYQVFKGIARYTRHE